MEQEIKTNLAILGYDFKWIEYGLLDLDQLNMQIEKFILGEDLNTEHYRYASFRKHIENTGVFTDQHIEYLLELALVDEDKGMSSAVIIELSRKDLTNQQFKKVINALRTYDKWTEKTISRLLNSKH